MDVRSANSSLHGHITNLKTGSSGHQTDTYLSPRTPLDPGEALKLFSPYISPQPVVQTRSKINRLTSEDLTQADHIVKANTSSQRSTTTPSHCDAQDWYRKPRSKYRMSPKTTIASVKAMDWASAEKDNVSFVFSTPVSGELGHSPAQLAALEHYRLKSRRISMQEGHRSVRKVGGVDDPWMGLWDAQKEPRESSSPNTYFGVRPPRTMPRGPRSLLEVCKNTRVNLGGTDGVSTFARSLSPEAEGMTTFPIAQFWDLGLPPAARMEEIVGRLVTIVRCVSDSVVHEFHRTRVRLLWALAILSVSGAEPRQKLKAIWIIIRVVAQILVIMYVLACLWRLSMTARDIVELVFAPLVWVCKGMKFVARL